MLRRIPRLWLATAGALIGFVGPLASNGHAASWHLQSVPPAQTSAQGSGQLRGVSCPSTSMCLAVGELGALEDLGNATTLGERWNGSSWSKQSTPNTPGAYAQELTAVSCYSATACTAVGYTETDNGGTSGGFAPLAERYNGKSWSIQSMPADLGSTYELIEGVSCPSATGCIAVGYESTAQSAWSPVSLKWDGSSWVQIPVPATGGSLAKLSCRSMTWCMAVGSGAVVEHWDGARWSTQNGPPGAGVGLDGISCPSTTECLAVGKRDTPVGYNAIAARYNGSTWTTQTTQTPPNANYSNLDAVYCSSARVCTASGWLEGNADNGTSTLAERWTGTSWSIQPTPNAQNPATWGNELKGIACPTSTTCESVGYVGAYTGDHGSLPVLAERYS
jgi:hypothetical protein